MKSQLLLFALLLSATPLTAQEPGTAPAYWFENVPAGDDSIQSSLVFRTIPGVQYTVETSHDLTNWTELESIYGMGHEFVTPMRQFTPPPPLPPGTPPPTPWPPTRMVSLRMTPSSATAGGTVVSWISLDDHTARMTLLPDSLHTGWAWLPLFSGRYGAYYFFVGHPLASIPPPVENPELGPLDAAMIATLQTSLADMNQRVADSIARARNSPPPAPPDPLSKKFWRIKADWGLDSDADGSPDWVEFAAAAANPAGVAGLRADAFDADTDHNAVLDGNQLDSDHDGIPDHEDAAPLDPAIATSIFAPRWRYAVFPVPAAKGPSNEDLEPRMINAQGKVLFPLSFWRQGALTPLITDNPDEISNCIALAMTDAGQVLGLGMAQRFEPAGVSGSSGWAATPPLVCAWWENPAVANPAQNPAAKPIIVQTPEPDPTVNPPVVQPPTRFAKPPLQNLPPDHLTHPAFPFDSLLANDTRFMADHTETATVNGNTFTVETRAQWRKTATGFSFTDDERYAQNGYDMLFVGGTDYVWGW